MFYDEFKEVARYVLELDSSTEPNYGWLEHRSKRLLMLSGARNGDCFEWCKAGCPSKRVEELWDIFNAKI